MDRHREGIVVARLVALKPRYDKPTEAHQNWQYQPSEPVAV